MSVLPPTAASASTASLISPGNAKTFTIITVAAGTGTLLGFATALLYVHFRQKIQFRKKSFDFVQLNEDMVSIKHELESLRSLVQQLQSQTNSLLNGGKKKSTGHSAVSSVSQTSLEAYFDATASLSESCSSKSENEYLMISKVQHRPRESVSVNNNDMTNSPIDRLMKVIDELQSKGSDEARAEAYELMKENYATGKTNSDFLWRYAMACYLYGQTFGAGDKNKRRLLCVDAQRYAFEALALKDDDSDIHKWCALTLGVMSDFVSMRQKIEDGHQFKLHIDRALELKPNDSVLHHLCGRWCFGVASLSWFERKVATALFAKPPDATFEDALARFLEAERLKPNWLENILYIVKVYLALLKIDQVKRWIKKASEIKPISADDYASKAEMGAIESKFD